MKNYVVAREIETDQERLYITDKVLKKDDIIVVPNYEDLPVTAIVIEKISHYQAIRSKQEPETIIDTVNVIGWLAEREKLVDREVLLDKMQKQISEIKMLETLEKYAGKDPSMLELLNEYKGNSTVIDDEEL